MHSSKLLLALFLAATLAPAQTARGPHGQVSVRGVEKRPMTFEDMMHMKRLGETAVSPDGKWLAYSVTTVDLDQSTRTPELFLQPISGGDAKPLSIAQPGDSGPQFSSDGKRILFLSGREGGNQIWLADFDSATGATGNPKKLTAISTEADNAKWSPDDKFIVFTSAVYPDCPAITEGDAVTGNKCNADKDTALAASKVKAQVFTHLLYRHWNHYTGDKRSHLFLVSVDTGALRDLTPNDLHDVPPFSLGGGGGFAISPDSKELAFTENLDPETAISTNADIFTLDLTNPSARPLKVSTSPGGDFNPAYSPDGKYLAWRSQARNGYEADKFRLLIYDHRTKRVEELQPKFELEPSTQFAGWVNELAWELDSRGLYFSSDREGVTDIYQIATNGEANRLRIPRIGEISDLHLLPKDKGLIAVRMNANQPGEVIRIQYFRGRSLPEIAPGSDDSGYYDFQGAKIEQITHLNDSLLTELDMSRPEAFWFKAADGTKVQGFLVRPPAFDPNKKYPVKFLIHGGPQGHWGDEWSWRWNAELLAANGYVVLMINPRGSTGYGQAFVDGVNGDWGGKPFTDLMLGLDYAEQHYGFIDKSRECALGASYGGYMANWILGHTDRFRCIVSHDGMFNAESAFGSTEEDWFNQWEFKGNPWDYYGKPDSENPFRKWSPSLYAKSFKTPTLVVHGQLDYRLDVSEGFQLFDTLQLLKVPSKMLYFPDEGHWVLKPQNSRLWYKTVNEWVDQWTKDSH
jgi:dipeptidyl aminopeptidase/acylaminoacyl peptidase